MANFFLLLGIGFTINFCLIRRYVLRWLNLNPEYYTWYYTNTRCIYDGNLIRFYSGLFSHWLIELFSQYSRVSDGVNKKVYNQRTIIIIGATVVSIAFYLLEVFLQFSVIYRHWFKNTKNPTYHWLPKKRADFDIMKKLIHSCTFPSNDTLSQRKG